MDEFKSLEVKEEEEEEEVGDGWLQVVRGKKKKRPNGQDGGSGSGSGAVMVAKDKAAAAEPWTTKAKVSFHDPSIPRPQDVYAIRVNNYNVPFDHVWLERSEDGSPIHPLEKLPVEQFIDRNVPESEPVKPADLEDTPFTLVEDKDGLADLAKKLKSVDLEHNQYRSFQGLTCLMQISTRTEDFIVDTLKLRIYIGLYLKEHFKDPTKRKVMHGADRDIMWLQRDFHIYVCNLFDTGQASRVLQMERNSLEHLLRHLCGVTANKEYAREDTHYLLYMYDLMKLRLQKESTSENDLLLEVQKRSNEICLQLYEKELLTDTSYLHIYGLQEHDLDAKQLAVVYALHQWRDYTAREVDESTGYILPNKALIEIAKKMPTDTAELKKVVKSKYPFVDESLDQIVDLIWSATESSYVFESRAEQLKKERLEQLGDRVQTLSSPEMKNSLTFSGPARPLDKEISSNNIHQQAQATFQELKRPMALGAAVGNSTSGAQRDFFGGFSNKQAEKIEKEQHSLLLAIRRGISRTLEDVNLSHLPHELFSIGNAGLIKAFYYHLTQHMGPSC
uniref:HRDC domain-containing protein n=1 Tax=Leersia perrieri TaxID=77586 RepID=A0A0D9VPR4_9ORYZ